MSNSNPSYFLTSKNFILFKPTTGGKSAYQILIKKDKMSK